MKFLSVILGPILLVYLIQLSSDGPLWHYIDSFLVNQCKNELKSSFLFYNNFVNDLSRIVSKT